MRSWITLLFAVGLLSPSLHAEETKEDASADYEMSIDLGEICAGDQAAHPQEQANSIPGSESGGTPSAMCPRPNPSDVPRRDLGQLLSKEIVRPERLQACDMIRDIGISDPGKPLVVNRVDPQGKKWKIKFYFGPAVTQYLPTTINIKSTDVNLRIRDFRFQDRNGIHHYDPSSWKSFEAAMKWADESTNKMVLQLQKGKNSIFISIFHPKFVTAQGFSDGNTGNARGTINGKEIDEKATIGKDVPVLIQETHRQMDWQIGYGREIAIFENGKSSLTYEPHVAAGITTGETNTGYVDGSGDLHRGSGKHEVQGGNVSIGQKLDYSRGRVSVFLDQSLNAAFIKHQFAEDGEASYDLMSNSVTLGVGVTLFQSKN